MGCENHLQIKTFFKISKLTIRICHIIAPSCVIIIDFTGDTSVESGNSNSGTLFFFLLLPGDTVAKTQLNQNKFQI